MGKFFSGIAASVIAALLGAFILSWKFGPISIYRIFGGHPAWTAPPGIVANFEHQTPTPVGLGVHDVCMISGVDIQIKAEHGSQPGPAGGRGDCKIARTDGSWSLSASVIDVPGTQSVCQAICADF